MTIVEKDYGYAWWDGMSSFPKYRVSLIERSGEVVAVNMGGAHHPDNGKIEVLGEVADAAEADAKLAGWAELEPYETKLDWIRARLA